MADILKGKPVADALKADTALRVSSLSDTGRPPAICTVRVGDSSDDAAYESSIAKAASNLGIMCEQKVFPESIDEASLIWHIEQINENRLIDGCILFRPLPMHIEEAKVCNVLSPKKDIDGVGAESLASVFMGEGIGYPPATAQACVEMLDFYGIDFEGSHIAIVGRSLVVGKPASMLMLDRNATVTLCHSKTSDLPSITRAADIVVCAVGKAGFFGKDYFREEQVVLDVGINVDSSGALCGDVAFDEVEPVVKAITPVPGGIGSISTAVLLEHAVSAAELHAADI